MAVDISKTKHTVAFPRKIAAAAGSPHQWDIVISANTDNGALCTRGKYVSFANYQAAAAPAQFAGKILEQTSDGDWYVEVTDPKEAIFLYNSPRSEYTERELRDEHYFYNKPSEGTVRGYELIKGDIFSISVEGFTGVPVAGKAVSYADGKYVVAS